MAKVKSKGTAKPFSVKGIRIVSPRGEALWCKVKEPDYQYNAKGVLSTTIICDPNDETVQAFIEKLEELRDVAYDETVETLGVKAKGVVRKDVYSEHVDQDGEDTGLIEFKFALKDADDRDKWIRVVDSKRAEIKDIPLVGNGSIIRCSAYANPYYMASTKTVGISLIWEQMQLINLVEYGGGDAFDDEDGYVDNGDDDFEDDDKPVAKTAKKVIPKSKRQAVDEDTDEDEDDADY